VTKTISRDVIQFRVGETESRASSAKTGERTGWRSRSRSMPSISAAADSTTSTEWRPPRPSVTVRWRISSEPARQTVARMPYFR
jgi:hypothetical protein